jgi:glutathione S-transferase
MALPVIHLYGPPLAPPVELSRWMLERLGIPYEFSPAAAGLSALRSWRYNVPIELPFLMVDGVPSGGVRQAYALITGPVAAAYGKSRPNVDAAFAEMLFADLFSAGVRTFYAHMLLCPKVLKPLATGSVPLWHRLLIRYVYPLWRWMMRRGLKLDSYDQAQAAASIAKCFAVAEKRMGGRAFIGGDAPSDEDVLFAVLSSPVLLPPGHPVKLPPVDAMPAELGRMVARLRQTVAGRLALRTYAAARTREFPRLPVN